MQARAVRCEASGNSVGRRSAALSGAAVLLTGLVGAREAKAVTCNMVTPCMPGKCDRKREIGKREAKVLPLLDC